MPRRLKYKGRPEIHYFCADCGFEGYGRNGIGLAAQHCDNYGHTCHVEIESSLTFTPEGSAWQQEVDARNNS